MEWLHKAEQLRRELSNSSQLYTKESRFELSHASDANKAMAILNRLLIGLLSRPSYRITHKNSSSDAIDDPDDRGFWVTLALWNKWRHETYRPTDGWVGKAQLL